MPADMLPGGAEGPFDGFRLFVVEDEALVAMVLETMLDSLGCRVVGIAGSVAQAMHRIEHVAASVDAAILDVNLGNERVFPVADALASRGVPFLFATGFGHNVGDRYPDHVVLAKPYTKDSLAQALAAMRVIGRGGSNDSLRGAH